MQAIRLSAIAVLTLGGAAAAAETDNLRRDAIAEYLVGTYSPETSCAEADLERLQIPGKECIRRVKQARKECLPKIQADLPALLNEEQLQRLVGRAAWCKVVTLSGGEYRTDVPGR